jgi:hypothetical protein
MLEIPMRVRPNLPIVQPAALRDRLDVQKDRNMFKSPLIR